MGEADNSLLAQAMAGDREALVRVLEQHGRALRQGLTGQIPRRWQSVLSEDDVMQQTYADAMRYITGFVPRGPDAFPRWLATLRNNNLRDAIEGLEADRRGGRARRIQPADRDGSVVALLDMLAVSLSTPSRCASREENKVLLQRALEQLPEVYARVIQLYDLEGLSVEEVAAALKRSPGAVFMLRARAHARLREVMGPASAFLTTIE